MLETNNVVLCTTVLYKAMYIVLQGDLSRAFSEGGVDECQPHQFKYTASSFKFMKPFLPTNTRLLRKTTYIIITTNKA